MLADGILLDEGHAGDGFQALTGINPSLAMVDGKPSLVDPSVDPFDPANGYNPNGASHYAQAFRTRYYAAQSKVMNAQIARVRALQDAIKQGEGPFPDNDIVLVPFSAERGAARLSELDPGVPEYMSTSKPEKLLKNNGTIAMQVIHSIEPPHPDRIRTNRSFEIGAKVLTIKSYLQHECDQIVELIRRRKLVFGEQFDHLRGAAHQGADPDRGDGRLSPAGR